MRVVDIIIKKRDRQELTRQEIQFFIQGYTAGEIPEYQAAAWAMAVLLNGMTHQEITDLTLAMAYSGDVLDLSTVVPKAVDKHSTGGVGDKTSLVVEPVVAACGLPVGKMSGRGLGFSGGTIDKIESIPGYRTDLSVKEFLSQLSRVGLVLSGQTGHLAPADGKLYALRDVTGTISSIPLIASSIISKKIAAGAQANVLDVKVGKGAFMRSLDEARHLAETMVKISNLSGRKAVALLSAMDQPLGCAVGNALEVKEAIDVLHQDGPEDFRLHCLRVAALMLILGEVTEDLSSAEKMAAQALASGAAWEKFRLLVAAQGGDLAVVDQPEKLPTAALVETVNSPRGGFLAGIDARQVGETAVELGAGRKKKKDPVDHAVGIVVHGKVGDQFEADQPLFTVYANDRDRLAQAKLRLLAAHTWSETPVEKLPLFYGLVT